MLRAVSLGAWLTEVKIHLLSTETTAGLLRGSLHLIKPSSCLRIALVVSKLQCQAQEQNFRHASELGAAGAETVRALRAAKDESGAELHPCTTHR